MSIKVLVLVSAALSNFNCMYVCKTIPRWRTAAIYKIDISPYLSEKWSDFDEILYTPTDIELDKRHVIKNLKKSCIGHTPSSTERISCYIIKLVHKYRKTNEIHSYRNTKTNKNNVNGASLGRTVQWVEHNCSAITCDYVQQTYEIKSSISAETFHSIKHLPDHEDLCLTRTERVHILVELA